LPVGLSIVGGSGSEAALAASGGGPHERVMIPDWLANPLAPPRKAGQR
jgi:hypothetical protein